MKASSVPLEKVKAHLEKHRPAGHTPRHEHDCSACIFLKNGPVLGEMRDWYLCPGAMDSRSFGGSLIARWGTCGEYSSFDLISILTWDDPDREGMNFGGQDPNGFVQQGKKLLAELGYRMDGKDVVLDVAD